MPFEIDFGQVIPLGYAAESVPPGSPSLKTALTGFFSSEDGDAFIIRLEGISAAYLDRIPPGSIPRESQIDNLLAVLHKDGKATVYVNELTMTAVARMKRAVKLGEPIVKDDITDIQLIELEGITIPPECAMVVLLSSGWRKGLYFDYTPIDPHRPRLRSADPRRLLAEMMTYLSFQERFKITDLQWEEIFRQHWFPFVGLTADQLRALLTHATLKAPIDSLLDGMVESARQLSARLREVIALHPVLKDHRQVLTKALEHFENGDYVSCAVMLFPKIEGVLRQRLPSPITGRPTQQRLAAAGVADNAGTRNEISILLPMRFERFLREVYFAGFDSTKKPEDVSRNTVSHGVAPEGKLTLKTALMAVLTLDQVVRLMPATNEDSSTCL